MTQAWLSPAAKSVWHFTSFPLFFYFIYFFLYICVLQKCNIIRIPRCCKEKLPFNAWNTLSPEPLGFVGSRRTFFLAKIFFSPSRVSFWSFDVMRNKENNNGGLTRRGRGLRKRSDKTLSWCQSKIPCTHYVARGRETECSHRHSKCEQED